MSNTITELRLSCDSRLVEVEFNLRRGTSSNSYLLKGAGGGYEVLIDVPSSVYDSDWVGQLAQLGATASLRSVILTRLNPERLPTLTRLLAALQPGVQLLVTNPGVQLLKDRSAASPELAEALRKARLVTITRSSELRLSTGSTLRFIPISTPRWPDLVAVYSEADKTLFSSNFFSAHVAQGATDGEGGWAAFGGDWQHYFDCMLAPSARQAASEWHAAGGRVGPLGVGVEWAAGAEAVAGGGLGNGGQGGWPAVA